ncbi:glycosyltransferase [Gephyromycinifex aptenodytis]|uniref:glycosyltransferase n=1 Tax=Gephyromycinifex aptenodytis TaxID=2716227 RepID=UPI0014466887|nr:glycosyltransferase [Gephyromycinifex aptenodytis]
MTFVLLALGSRGDVQPLATLAGALSSRGHDALVIGIEEYAGLAAQVGARFVPVPGSLSDAVARGPIRDRLGASMIGQAVLLNRWLTGLAPGFLRAVLDHVGPGDVVLSGVLTRGAAAALADARGCRAATIVYTGQPVTLHPQSFCFASYFTGFTPYDRWGARFTWKLATALGRTLTTRARSQLGLPGLGFNAVAADADRHPTIVAADPLLVPPAPDWAPNVHQSGYLAPPPRPYTPNRDLAELLDRRPVYVGFGSLTQFTSAADTQTLVAAAALSGRPILTLAPAGAAPGFIASNVYAMSGVPFDWLFPRVAGAIHHGGSGTSQEALRSGVPCAVIPIGVDQPYHAERLHRLGLGPAPLSHRRLTGANLAHLITDMLDSPRTPGYQQRARDLGHASRQRDGVGATITVLDQLGYLR